MAETLLQIKDLVKEYGETRILDGVNLDIAQGEGFMQGIFVEYGITVDDDVTSVRNGGFGSTTQS